MKGKAASKKVIIVGGVAGGASCAARLRRLDEDAQIIMVERGPYVSYANCGLPYHVGGVIERESSLLVADENTFRSMFAIDVRTHCECVKVSPDKKTVELRNVATGEVTTESYDKLVLSPGAPSIRPPLPGIDLPGIFELRTVPDAKAIREWLEKGSLFLAGMHRYAGFQSVRPKTRAVVVGGGFIGIETAENLIHRGFDVTLVEMGDQILAPMDPEMARIAEGYLERHGLRLALKDGVAGFEQGEGGTLKVLTKSGKAYPADVVILALGVRPDTALAKAAGLELGQRGGIRVDDQMRTSNPDIFAVGDAMMVAADILRGDMPVSHWASSDEGFLLDVREPVELAVETEPRAVNIPLGQLRSRLGELPRDREIFVICRSGGRAYYATRVLQQKGFKARTLAGGMLSRTHAANFWTT